MRQPPALTRPRHSVSLGGILPSKQAWAPTFQTLPLTLGAPPSSRPPRPTQAGHFLRADHHQQERPGHPQQHPAHDPEEQVPPGFAHGERGWTPEAGGGPGQLGVP